MSFLSPSPSSSTVPATSLESRPADVVPPSSSSSSSSLGFANLTSFSSDAVGFPSDDALLTSLRSLLISSDLAVATVKSLTKELEARFGAISLKSKKDLIKNEILEYISRMKEQDEDSETLQNIVKKGKLKHVKESDREKNEKSNHKNGGEEDEADHDTDGNEEDEDINNNSDNTVDNDDAVVNNDDDEEDAVASFNERDAYCLSSQMSSFIGKSTSSLSQCLKAVRDYAQENGLQDRRRNQPVVCDEKLFSLFNTDVVADSVIAKGLKQHFLIGEKENRKIDVVAPPNASGNGSGTKRKRPITKKQSSGKSNSTAHHLQLSPALAAVVGAPTMTRGNVVKTLWEYIKSHNLQDPADRRKVNTDSKLFDIFKKKSVTMFSLNRDLTKHMKRAWE